MIHTRFAPRMIAVGLLAASVLSVTAFAAPAEGDSTTAIRVNRAPTTSSASQAMSGSESPIAVDPSQASGQIQVVYQDANGVERTAAISAVAAQAETYACINAGGDALRVMDQIGDENSSDSCWLQQLALKDAISRLTPRQREILALRYSEGKTQMEVSREIGISQAQVSRLEKGAIGEIKKNM